MSALFTLLLLVSLALSAAVAFAPERRRRAFGLMLGAALVLVWVSLGLSLFGIVDRTSNAIVTRLSARRPQHVESAAGGALTLLVSLGGPAALVTALALWALRSAKAPPRGVRKVRGPTPKLAVVSGPGRELEEVRALFADYARSLDYELCFDGLDKELAGLPGDYAPPRGRLWLARIKGQPAGCVALKPLPGDAVELKRLFVRSAYRHVGLGRALALLACEEAKKLGYLRVRLETVPRMREAVVLYRSMGFLEIPPYREKPLPGALYLERAV